MFNAFTLYHNDTMTKHDKMEHGIKCAEVNVVAGGKTKRIYHNLWCTVRLGLTYTHHRLGLIYTHHRLGLTLTHYRLGLKLTTTDWGLPTTDWGWNLPTTDWGTHHRLGLKLTHHRLTLTKNMSGHSPNRQPPSHTKTSLHNKIVGETNKSRNKILVCITLMGKVRIYSESDQWFLNL